PLACRTNAGTRDAIRREHEALLPATACLRATTRLLSKDCSMRLHHLALYAVLSVGVAACGDIAKLPVSAGTGPNPVLPPPEKSVIPTVNVAPAKGWPE